MLALYKEKASRIYYKLLILLYLVIILEVILKILPLFSFITLTTILLAFKAIKITRENFDKIKELLPANAATIVIHTLVTLLLAGSFIIDKIR